MVPSPTCLPLHSGGHNRLPTMAHVSFAQAAHRLIAFYLPQFHPIPENDRWWGKGYTEWTAVARARPMFPGHRQPRYPGELGYYDLRVPDTREHQANLARAHGIEGFCYWHFWLGNGKTLLDRPFREVLASKEPDFPFCLAWANHDWFDKSGRDWKLLIKQQYPGRHDEATHFRHLEPAFHDERYVKVDGRPVFLIFEPDQLPEPQQFIEHWRHLADQSGLQGLFFIGRSLHGDLRPEKYGLDAIQPGQILPFAQRAAEAGQRFHPDFLASSLNHWLCRRLHVLELQSYRKWSPYLPHLARAAYSFPVVYSNWDSTPRWGRRGLVMRNESAELFGAQLRRAMSLVADRPDDHRLVFLKSWNEWAEGNYLEPDRHSGRALLETLRAVVTGAPASGPLQNLHGGDDGAG